MVERAVVSQLGREDLPEVGRLFSDHTGRAADLEVIGTWIDSWPALAARRGDDVVGYVATNRFGPDIIELTALLIAPEVRGQGIGSALLAALDDAGRAVGANGIVVVTSSAYVSMEPRRDPVGFYQRAGYRSALRTSLSTVLVRELEER